MKQLTYNQRYYRSHKEQYRRYRATDASRRPLSVVWTRMRVRCGLIKSGSEKHPYYEGKGITVCDEWRDYKTFEKWALENGWEKNLQLDRIDNEGNYEPKNCRFVTPSKNCRNRSNNVIVNYKGKNMTLVEAIEKCKTKLTYQAIWNRIFIHGWSVEKALSHDI